MIVGEAGGLNYRCLALKMAFPTPMKSKPNRKVLVLPLRDISSYCRVFRSVCRSCSCHGWAGHGMMVGAVGDTMMQSAAAYCVVASCHRCYRQRY